MTFFRFIRSSLVLLLCGFFSANAAAVSWQAPLGYFWVSGQASSHAEACAGAAGSYGVTLESFTEQTSSGSTFIWNVWIAFTSSATCYKPVNTSFASTLYGQYCPNNASRSWVGPTLFCNAPTCPAGYTLEGATCLPPAEPCPQAGTPAWSDGVVSVTGTYEGYGGKICANGCEIVPGGTEMGLPQGNGVVKWYPQTGTYTGVRLGSECTAAPDDPSIPPVDLTPQADTPDGVPTSPADCPAGSAFGQVNGQNVCAPAGTKINYVPDTSTTTTDDQTLETTTQKTDTVQADGSIKSSSTTTASSGGSSTSTNITNNYGGGTGFTAGGGTGDSNTNNNINLGPAPKAESGDVVLTLPGPGSGSDGAGGADRQFGITQHFSGAQSCIADRSISAMGVDVVIPLSALCPWFDMMYKIISMVGIFVALRILVMS